MMNWAATPQDCQRGDRKDAKGGFAVSANGDELPSQRALRASSSANLALPEVAKATPTDGMMLLALKGRQSTDGGERSVTPGPMPHPTPSPSLAPSALGGGVINLP